MKLKWSPQQEIALAGIATWLKDPNGPQIYRVFGFAGVGKTELAKEVKRMVRGLTLYGAFTGKAAVVMRGKGCDDASTLHSMAYTPEQDKITGEFIFKINPESAIRDAKVLVIDEVSMVGEQLARDVLSFGTKVLVLGDPFQLPPVGDAGFFTNAKPDVMLTEVHRQALDNPIVRLATDLRNGIPLRPGDHGETRLLDRHKVDRMEAWHLISAQDQVLCGRNNTRQIANMRMRRDMGFAKRDAADEWKPVTGDRVICLRNQHDVGLLNGMLFDVISATGAQKNKLPCASMRLHWLDRDKKSPIDVFTPREFFEGKEKALDWRQLRGLQQFTFGWAMTVHKAQGSQFDTIGIIDEAGVFGEDADRHRYTALTRAAKHAIMLL